MKKNFLMTKLPYIFLGLGILLGIFRLWYFTYSNIPLGYDPGMYKEIFSHYRTVITSLDFSLLPQRIRHEPLLGILAALVNKLGISFDRMLTRGIGILNLIPGILLFRYFKSTSKNLRWGVFAAMLYRTSIIQYQVFWSGYFKQILGVSVMLLVLIMGERKKLLLQSILFFLLILLHKHTALYTGCILAISVLVECIQNKKIPWEKILYRVIAGSLALLIYIPLRGRIMTEAVKAVGENIGGDFISPRTYVKYSWPIILLSILGIGWKIRDLIITKEKKIDVWMIGYGIGAIWLLFSLINYNRTIIFFDVFAIIFAAYFLFKIWQFRSAFSFAGISFFLCIVSLIYFSYSYNKSSPLINQEEFTSIKNIATLTEKNALIMNTHREYSPWIMGRSQRDYINPGMSDMDLWTHQEWNQWRSGDGKQKCDMLLYTYAKLSRPLYIWLGSMQFVENLSGGYCFAPITGNNNWILLKVNLP